MSHSITLTWVAPTNTSVTSYDVRRALVTAGVDGPFVEISNPEPTATTYVDNGPFVEGATYAYEVLARNSAGESVPSAEVRATIPFLVPDAPTALVAKAV